MASISDLWCSDCGKSHEGMCKKHGALHKVQDAAIPSRARLTLPSSLVLRTVKENGKSCVGVFSKKIISMRSQFGPLDAPVVNRYKQDCKEKDTPTVWKKKHAMQKAMETLGQSITGDTADIHTSMSDNIQTSPVLAPLPPVQHRVSVSSNALDPSSVTLTVSDQSMGTNLHQQLMSMSGQIIPQSGMVDSPLPGLATLPLQSSPISGHTLNQLQHGLPEFTPISFPSPGSMQIHVTHENLQALQNFHQFGQHTDLTGVQHTLGLNGFVQGPDTNGAGLITVAPPHEVDSQDSGVGDTSQANLSDSLVMDVTSDTDMDDSSELDMNFEFKVVTEDGFVEVFDSCDEEHSNWMIFVRPASNVSEQNLIAYQEDGNIYFVSLKPIPTNTELKVWYSSDYAKAISKGLLVDDDKAKNEDDKLTCTLCNTIFNTSIELDSHACLSKGKGRRKGRPRKYVKPTKTWRAKLEKSRLKESKPAVSADGSTTVKRGRGRPRLKNVKEEKVEVKEIEMKVSSPLTPSVNIEIKMHGDSDNDEDIHIFSEEGGEDETDPSYEKKLVIKEKKKRAHKTSKSPLQCPHCGDSFLAEAAYYIHVYQHTGVKPFICEYPECHRGFLSKFKLERHRLIHTCPRHHKCPSCDKSFNRKDHLKNHMVTHDPNKKVWKCDLCGKEYSYSFSYRTHMAFHSAENGDTLTCDICKKSFDSKESLLFHLKVHTGARAAKNSTEKTHQCFECGKKFFTRKDVRRHMITHTKRKDFLCQYCPQRFGRKDHLTRHLRTSHTGDNNNSTPESSPVRQRRNTGDGTSSPSKRRERAMVFEKLEHTMVPLQISMTAGLPEELPEQLLSNGSQSGQATLIQNLQYAVSQIPGHPINAREIQIPAALYEAAAAAAAQQQQQQQQQQQTQQIASLGSLQAQTGLPTIHTSLPAQYQISDKGYIMNAQPAEQAVVRQIQVAPNVDYRNITQTLNGNMYITTANPSQIQQPVQHHQPQQQQTILLNKIDPQTIEIRGGNITTLQPQLQASPHQHQQQQQQQIPEYQIISTSLGPVASGQDAGNRTSVVMAGAIDPRQTSHAQTYSTLLGYMETLRFLENLPTTNTAIPLQQLQGLNLEMSQAQLIPAGAYSQLSGGTSVNNLVNIQQADLGKGVMTIAHPHGGTLQLTTQDLKNMVSLAQTSTPTQQHIQYQQQT